MPDVSGKNRVANGQFKPGVSGNPKGLNKLEVVMRKVFQFAVEGRPWAVQFIADRTEGKALERIDQTTRHEPITVFNIDD